MTFRRFDDAVRLPTKRVNKPHLHHHHVGSNPVLHAGYIFYRTVHRLSDKPIPCKFGSLFYFRPSVESLWGGECSNALCTTARLRRDVQSV